MIRYRKIVIALGGNAIDSVVKNGEGANKRLNNFCKILVNLLKKKWHIVLTHGNGPQVGNLFLQQELAKEYITPLTLNICVALSQAQVGTILQQKISSIILKEKINKEIIPLLTTVLVDEKDSAFQNPTKPIGPAYTEIEAKRMSKRGMIIKQMPEGLYRRVVASPRPLKIMEIEIIRNLIRKGILVVAAGGGGIPIIIKNKKIQPIDAVIDKDLASALLAKEIKAPEMMILTNIDYVCLNYRKFNEQKIRRLSPAEAQKYLKNGQFAVGSMGPKIEAAINFLRDGGERVIIGHLEEFEKILKGQSGTIIEK